MTKVMTKVTFSIFLALTLSHGLAYAEDCKNTAQALEALKSRMARNGEPKIVGTADLDGKTVPGLQFGRTKVTKNFDAVDEVKAKCGGTATLFVKNGEDFVRVSTNVMKDGTVRAIGTPLAKNKAYESIIKGEKFCGDVEILGKTFDTCYEPIKSGAETVGIYYVGYPK